MDIPIHLIWIFHFSTIIVSSSSNKVICRSINLISNLLLPSDWNKASVSWFLSKMSIDYSNLCLMFFELKCYSSESSMTSFQLNKWIFHLCVSSHHFPCSLEQGVDISSSSWLIILFDDCLWNGCCVYSGLVTVLLLAYVANHCYKDLSNMVA